VCASAYVQRSLFYMGQGIPGTLCGWHSGPPQDRDSLSYEDLSSSFSTRFWHHSIARPSAENNYVVRFELRPTCLHRQRIQFLLVTSTSTFAFTWHGIGGHTRTFVRRVAHWLLQRCPGGCAESDDQQNKLQRVSNSAARVVKFDRGLSRFLYRPSELH